jgi:hypothetical protein
MFPDGLAAPHLGEGSLLRIFDEHFNVPLFWHAGSLDSPLVQATTDAVDAAAASLRRRRK